jgi:hypothetical protein
MDGWKAVANEGAAIPLAVGGPVTDARRTVQGLQSLSSWHVPPWSMYHSKRVFIHKSL